MDGVVFYCVYVQLQVCWFDYDFVVYQWQVVQFQLQQIVYGVYFVGGQFQREMVVEGFEQYVIVYVYLFVGYGNGFFFLVEFVLQFVKDFFQGVFQCYYVDDSVVFVDYQGVVFVIFVQMCLEVGDIYYFGDDEGRDYYV